MANIFSTISPGCTINHYCPAKSHLRMAKGNATAYLKDISAKERKQKINNRIYLWFSVGWIINLY